VAKIAFLLPDLGAGGAERIAITLAHAFREAGQEVEFVLMQKKGELLEALPSDVRVVDLGAQRIRQAIRPLVGYFRESKTDAVQARMWPLTVAAIAARRLARSPARLVVSDHISLSHQAGSSAVKRALVRLTTRLFYPLADARVGVSEGVAQDLSRLSGIPREDFTLIYNPVAAPGVAAQDSAVEHLWGSAKARFLTVGTLKEQKNHALLIEGFARVAERLDAKLVIVGEGHLRGALERRIKDLELHGRVELVGYVPDPSPYYESADVFVLSSDYEGFAIVIVEALHHALGVVSTDCPSGPAEILCGGRFGRLVPVGDCAALAQAMADEWQTKRKSEELRARAAEFSLESAASAYLGLLVGDREGSKAIPER